MALEFKASEKAKATKLQEYNIYKIVKANGFAFFVYPENWERIFSILKTLTEKEPTCRIS